MSLVLGQDARIRPAGRYADGSPLTSWTEAKALYFRVTGYEVHCEEVKRFHESDARVKIATAPARTSKSYTGKEDVVAYAAMPTEPACDTLIWVIGPTFKTNKEFDYLYDLFVNHKTARGPVRHPALMPPEKSFIRAINSPGAGDMELRWVKQRVGGVNYTTRILGLSSENEKTLQGDQVTAAIMSEAAEHPAHIYEKYIASRTRWTILPTTPKAKAAKWLKEDLVDRAAGLEGSGVEAFDFPPEANPLYDWEARRQAEVRALARARALIGPTATAEDDPLFAEQFLGRWVQYTGRVLPFSRARNVVAEERVGEILRHCRIHVSTDYGYEDPAVALFWAVHPSGLLFIFDEVYERHLTTEPFVERIEARLEEHRVKASRVCGDPSRPEVERVMQEAGLRVYPIDKNAQRDRAAGFRRLQDLLTEGPVAGFPGIYVSERCERTIDEWESLLFRDGFANEYAPTALQGEDHAADAARYYLMSRPKGEEGRSRNPDADIAAFLRARRQGLGYSWKTGRSVAA